MQQNQPKLISLIVPCLNEEDNVENIYNEICKVWNKQVAGYDFELIFVDDNSTDSTFSVLERLAKADSRVTALRLSRTFGHQKAIFCGMIHSTGDAAVQLD